MKIELINNHFKKIPEPFKKSEVVKLVDRVLEKIDYKNLENKQINIKYTSEEEMKMLNEKFYKKQGVTNVLAFSNFLEFRTPRENLAV